MNDTDLHIALLEGMVNLQEEELTEVTERMHAGWKSQDFWRRMYLRDHPEHDNWEWVEEADGNEELLR